MPASDRTPVLNQHLVENIGLMIDELDKVVDLNALGSVVSFHGTSSQALYGMEVNISLID